MILTEKFEFFSQLLEGQHQKSNGFTMEHRWCRPKDESFYPKVHSFSSGKSPILLAFYVTKAFSFSLFLAVSTSKKVKVRISVSLCLKANNISPQIIHEINKHIRVCAFFLFATNGILLMKRKTVGVRFRLSLWLFLIFWSRLQGGFTAFLSWQLFFILT